MVAEALRKELKRIKLRRALDESLGALSSEAHPELEWGTERYVRQIRRSTRATRVAEE